MTALTQTRMSKVVAHALRHEPWLYELELDDEGWTPISELLESLHAKGGDWSRLTADDLAAMVSSSPKRRYELDGHRIRALYGHSVPGRLAKQQDTPPGVLFHGTSPRAWEVIQATGLVPMGRQYVHLSADAAMALHVGRRKADRPAIVEVRAASAASAGVPFYRGNDYVWLADAVPPCYLALAVTG